jgi:glycosyltransferase involved in cell wall biosynthesis
MKILQVLNSGIPGGVEQHTLDLVTGLVKHGEEVHVVCNEGPIVVRYREAGATVATRNINIDIDPTYIYWLSDYIRMHAFDVVHAHELKAGFNTIVAAKIGGAVKIFSHIHTPISEWQIKTEAKRMLTKAEIFLYSQAVNLLSTSEIALTSSKKETKIKEGIKPEKIVVMPNGIDTDQFEFSDEVRKNHRTNFFAKYKLPENATIIGNVARLSPEKGQIHLLDAFAQVLSDYHGENPLFLLIAGGGVLELELKNHAQLLKIEDKIIFTGLFVNQDLPEIYSSIDIFVFPSLAEGFGLVMLEAMANKIPVLASDLDVLQEVGGPDMVYFKTADSTDIARAINHLLEMPIDDRSAIGNKLHQRVVSKFGVEQFIANYIKLYRGEL